MNKESANNQTAEEILKTIAVSFGQYILNRRLGSIENHYDNWNESHKDLTESLFVRDKSLIELLREDRQELGKQVGRLRHEVEMLQYRSQCQPVGAVWVSDFENATFERAAGRHEKNGKYVYFTILKIGNLYNFRGDHLHDAGELAQAGIEYLTESNPAPAGDWDELESKISYTIGCLEQLPTHTEDEVAAYQQVLNWIAELRGKTITNQNNE